ncbi:MAG: ribose-phosphate pyrophosphokinase [Proteobacteria bacterium]|nr:ribose-phosphate pyrophosphokinase [Pseudomonadota bacterium]MCH9757582.1 ribose-phosphate pyrophosphokinase [Pseudomonadota bacterium]
MNNNNNNSLEDLVLFAGGACPELARAVAKHLKINLGRQDLRLFSDGENYVELMENVRGKNVFILQSISAPANNNLMELMLMADAVRRASASDIVAVVPYLGYSRQDRRPRSARVPISARVIADMLTSVGIGRVLTMDLHAEQIQGFYQIPVENIYAAPVLMGDISTIIDPDSSMIVAPDVGGVVRARAFASALATNLAIIDKRRPRANVAKVMHIIGDVKGKDCFIVDDIVDTANTLCQAATALKEQGATRVAAYCTHPVLSGAAVERIVNSEIDELVICDTISATDEITKCDKIRVLTVSHILAETVARIYNNSSISSLF